MGGAFIAIADDATAASDFGRVLEVSPKEPNLHFMRGLALLRMGRDDLADAAFRSCARLNPAFMERTLSSLQPEVAARIRRALGW